VTDAGGVEWVFERVNPNTSGSSGKIIDLFRNEGVMERGHLAEDAPSLAATLMAREVIQNAWDAARELRQGRDDVPPFAIDFDFRVARGALRNELVSALGLEGLAHHAHEVAPTPDEREKLGLGTGDCLRDLEDRDEISFCRIVEQGASGMYGPWMGAESRMYLAMLSIGYNEKADGSGGTFGYGKAGLIRASHARIVLAYSCFEERADDPGVTRRLLGVTYWGRHKRAGVSLNGFARFGHRISEDEVVPFENGAADEIAAGLGLDVRDPGDPVQLGTTFLVIDPSVEPDELVVAIERNWWPALVEDRFTVIVSRSDESERVCRPRANPQLGAFLDAYEHIKSEAPAASGVARLWDLGAYGPQGSETLQLGKLALVAQPDGWSFPDEAGNGEGGVESRSLVVLTRDPRMVVEYHLPGRDIARRVPYVRGVFVASPQVNALLSKTEPKAHDKWDTHASDDVPELATKFAARVLDEIKSRVKSFQDELRPPVDETGAVRLQRLDEKLSKLRNRQGTKPPRPPVGDRPFSIQLDVRRVPSGDELVLSGSVDVRLADHVTASVVPARIRIAFAIEEDGRRGSAVPLDVEAPPGFERLPGNEARYEGHVTLENARFRIRSDPYRADWTGELLVSGEDLRTDESEEAA
jgi:hypothetical protein